MGALKNVIAYWKQFSADKTGIFNRDQYIKASEKCTRRFYFFE